MKAIVTVIGKDMVGILSKASTSCANANANVMDVTQSILQDYFVMVMIIDGSNLSCSLIELKEHIQKDLPEMDVHLMHEDIFNTMHKI